MSPFPRPNTWPLNIRRLGRFRPYRPSDSLCLAVSPICHIPPDKLFECLDNSRMHSNR
jgi:hypothetical protein